jgi:hypothetical protein
MAALVYTPVGWVAETTKLSAANFNQMEAGIIAATNAINAGGGAAPWADVMAASFAPVTLTAPGATLDGVTLTAGDRVLIAGQAAFKDDGIYVWNGAAVPMTRAADAANPTDFTFGRKVYVTAGSRWQQSTWSFASASNPTIGTGPLKFVLTAQPNLAGRTFVCAASSTAEGPMASGADGTYNSCSLGLDPGVWAIHGQATMKVSVQDGKQLYLYNATAAAVVANSGGPIDGQTAANQEAAMVCFAVVSLTVTSTIRLYGKRNGGSAISWGYGGALGGGASDTGEQALKAYRLA